MNLSYSTYRIACTYPFGISRSSHDYYDVVAGALLGIGSAYIFTKPFKNKIELTTGSNQGIQTYGLRINL